MIDQIRAAIKIHRVNGVCIKIKCDVSKRSETLGCGHILLWKSTRSGDETSRVHIRVAALSFLAVCSRISYFPLVFFICCILFTDCHSTIKRTLRDATHALYSKASWKSADLPVITVCNESFAVFADPLTNAHFQRIGMRQCLTVCGFEVFHQQLIIKRTINN